MFPRGRKLLLGVSGGISAYKSCELLRRLQDQGFIVDVVPTGKHFLGVKLLPTYGLMLNPCHIFLWQRKMT